MRKIYSPTSESELIFLQSLLQAHDVPYVIDQGGFGAALPGLYIDHYTRKWITVPDTEVERARQLIHEHLSTGVGPDGSEEMGLLDKLRIVVEAVLFGWFVPGRRGRREQGHDTES